MRDQHISSSISISISALAREILRVVFLLNAALALAFPSRPIVPMSANSWPVDPRTRGPCGIPIPDPADQALQADQAHKGQARCWPSRMAECRRRGLTGFRLDGHSQRARRQWQWPIATQTLPGLVSPWGRRGTHWTVCARFWKLDAAVCSAERGACCRIPRRRTRRHPPCPNTISVFCILFLYQVQHPARTRAMCRGGLGPANSTQYHPRMLPCNQAIPIQGHKYPRSIVVHPLHPSPRRNAAAPAPWQAHQQSRAVLDPRCVWAAASTPYVVRPGAHGDMNCVIRLFIQMTPRLLITTRRPSDCLMADCLMS